MDEKETMYRHGFLFFEDIGRISGADAQPLSIGTRRRFRVIAPI